MAVSFSAIMKNSNLSLRDKFRIYMHLRSMRFSKTMPRYLHASDLSETSPIRLTDAKFVQSELDAFVKRADYANRFPKYVEEFGEPRQPKGVLERKYAEQYLSLAVVDWESLAKDDIIIDVAASNSPFQEVMLGFGYENTYKTDLNYKTSEDLKMVGCNANDMSYFKDGSVSLIVSHNAWEHFEADSDIEYLQECARILKPGGKTVIIPLVLYDIGINTTDPSIWSTKYRNASDFPVFDAKFPMHIGDHKQRLMKFYDPDSLAKALDRVDCDFEIMRVENGGGNEMVLIGTKR